MANIRDIKFTSRGKIKRYLDTLPAQVQNTAEFTEALDAEIERLILRAVNRSKLNKHIRLMRQDV